MYFFLLTWGNFPSKIGVSLWDIAQKAVTLQHQKLKKRKSEKVKTTYLNKEHTMKARTITLMLLAAICLSTYAQDDDMYSFSSKKKAKNVTASTGHNTSSEENTYVDADYHTGDLFDVDEYNRRGKSQQADTPSYQLVGDTLYVSSTGEPTQSESVSYNEGYTNGYYDELYDGDFCLTSRLYRYRGFRLYDPYIWDISYGWYDPWYDPWYGWYSPYYHYGYTGWYNWGWHHYGGWNYGWNYPHYGGYYGSHHGGHHDVHKPSHTSTVGRSLSNRSATYNGRAGGGRFDDSRINASRSAAANGSRGTYRSNSNTSSRNSNNASRNNSTYIRSNTSRSSNTTSSRGSYNSSSSRSSSTYNSSSSRSSNSYSSGGSRNYSSGSSAGFTNSSSRGGGGYSGGSSGGSSRGGGGGGSRGGGRR